MIIQLKELTDLVALRLGEFPEWRGSEGVTMTEGVALEEFVRPLAEPHARQAVLSLALSDCTDLRDLSPVIIDATDWGDEDIYSCELPADFLRLHSIWMPDWPCPLNEEDAGDGLRRSLGRAAPSWLLKRSRRPMLRLVGATDTAAAQLWFGPTAARRPLQSAYIAAPRFDTGSDTLLNMQPEALMPLVDAIAEKIARRGED